VSRPFGSLLPPASAELAEGLAALRNVIDVAMPLKSKHRAALPGGVARLSALLTTEREHLPPDYMARPEHLSAYLHWFLPWNVYRQGRLLQGLDLDLPAGARILDLGAGPLTFLIALWLARPDLRDRELHYLAVDRAESALRTGRTIFAAVAGEKTPWRVETTSRGPGGPGRADLLVAANLINELAADRAGRQRGPEADPQERQLMGWEKSLAPGGRLLLIEPGVRPASARLVRLRTAAIERGWHVGAPCPHQETCPLPGRRGGSWCHFTAGTEGVPRWLSSLGKAAKMPKERASLSFLLLDQPRNDEATDPNRVRIVSDDFELPGRNRGRYACSAKGLLLLRERAGSRNEQPASGDMMTVRWPDAIERDPRSHAMIIDRD